MIFRILLPACVAMMSVSSHAGTCKDMPVALATMREIDQYLRAQLTAKEALDEQAARMIAIVDRQNTKRLAAFLETCGWPRGRDGDWQASDDAWLLAQHADRDREFQHRALVLLEQAVRDGYARGKNLAYLTDRVALAEGRPQLYGTQFKVDGCELELLPHDSREEINKRRKAIPGMPTLEEYEKLGREKILPASCRNGE